ncbi:MULTISPECIES: flagellar biosynthesis anti-sigma factor FlgM [unclassified Novosphingobium]|uniref:flagellar biosynthesis anti-sigma factor FlgM n=1 Tax=unclassified Novosphingobium TaxID=2644732 RepID=UPI00086A7742|nr:MULTISPECIES: flagellar biosynthesis anti-sigma factor FlgM [unclassified Novosphingobium]MBN9143239.1 flagellar biosynthesis anti-sigma factor FlgM [Novosphingobium sp.]MDR6706327.1 negative regulator of flagellin synthesis FlgM [Novosphingobium sp. 1748]NKJ01187.1 negative regulator of flagellin synthesis FlgM [Novosphingobium sp. SG707]ODU82672.1 MAG: flagellar biosynthesis anti-sigma factor FlgM [Novosphingobium sp. SCN 63-17]OJX89558.1 MAG: flagellar biosynthesis anti-sigma factor FlgM
MSSIGSGPGIGSGPKLQVNAVRPVATSSAATPSVSTETRSAGQAAAGSPVNGDGATVVSTTAISAGDAPVDTDRVASIRKAIADGNYPIIPTKISDAMIAAGMMLRV